MSRGPKRLRLALSCAVVAFTMLPAAANATWNQWWEGNGPLPQDPAKLSANPHYEYGSEARKQADGHSNTYACNNIKIDGGGYGTSGCTNQSIYAAGHYGLCCTYDYFDVATSQVNVAYQSAQRDN